MYRLTFMLRRRPGTSFDEFRRYWLEQHAPLVRRHAGALGIRRYVQVHNLSDPDLHPELPFRGTMLRPYDGAAELWFAHRDDVAAALSSPEGAAAGAALLEDEQRFIHLAESPLWFCCELPQINPQGEDLVAAPDSPIYKIYYPLRQPEGMTLEEAQSYWRMYHGPLVRLCGRDLGLLRYIQVHRLEDPLNQALAESRGVAVEAFAGHAELWCSSDAAAAGAAAQRAAELLAQDEARFIDFTRSSIWYGKEHVIVDRRATLLG